MRGPEPVSGSAAADFKENRVGKAGGRGPSVAGPVPVVENAPEMTTGNHVGRLVAAGRLRACDLRRRGRRHRGRLEMVGKGDAVGATRRRFNLRGGRLTIALAARLPFCLQLVTSETLDEAEFRGWYTIKETVSSADRGRSDG